MSCEDNHNNIHPMNSNEGEESNNKKIKRHPYNVTKNMATVITNFCKKLQAKRIIPMIALHPLFDDQSKYWKRIRIFNKHLNTMAAENLILALPTDVKCNDKSKHPQYADMFTKFALITPHGKQQIIEYVMFVICWLYQNEAALKDESGKWKTKGELPAVPKLAYNAAGLPRFPLREEDVRPRPA